MSFDRPQIWLKAAASLDGRSATRTGESQWITGAAARRRGRALRGEVDAILVGVQTVVADDPQLTTRIAGASDPLRVVLDSRCRTPADAVVAATAERVPTLIATTARSSNADRRRLTKRGVLVEEVPQGAEGRVDLEVLLAGLWVRGIRRLLVEGGPTVAGSFVDAGLVDRVYWFAAPMIIGGSAGAGCLGGQGAGPLSEATRLKSVSCEPVGDDFLFTGDVIRGPP